MSVFNSFIAEVQGVEQTETNFLTLPKLINPYLGSCKVILFCDKKEEGLCIALHNKINLRYTQNQSQEEYINFSRFVQVTRDYSLAMGFRNDIRKEFDLIRYKKLEDNEELDNKLLAEFNLTWYPLIDVKDLLSPIELSFIERMNQPATFAIKK